MIQNNENSNKIKENKYKILRMSLLLGNGEDKEETINNFEDAAREIDAMNDQIYLKDLESKYYDTLTLEEEEKKLTILVDYIGGRIEQRMSLLEDFSNVTGYELINLPPIKYQERLEEYKNRLFYIREYLDNIKNIENLNKEIDNLENNLNNSYVNKAKSEERNIKSEDELQERYNRIIQKKEELKEIDKENAESKLIDIKSMADDSKKSLDIFNKSFATLNEAGISGEEKEEYSSYVKSAKEEYYNIKEIEYLVRLYITINKKEKEYNQILMKRDSINEIINERIALRKELKIMDEDLLSILYPTLERQYNDIFKQKDNIDNIEYLISEINNKKELVSNLEKDNQKVEILSLLKEFCIIDTYDENEIIDNNEKNTKEEDIAIDKEEDNYKYDEELPTIEEAKEQEEINEIDFDNIEEVNNENISEPINEEISNEENDESSEENFEEETPFEESSAEESSAEETQDLDLSNVEDNQVIEVKDTNKINLTEAIEKSNGVMKRVGEMLGVKIEKEETPKEETASNDTNELPKEEEKTEPVEEIPNNIETTSETTTEEPTNNKADDSSSEPANIDITENIFMNDNYDADPETKMNSETEATESKLPTENPLFNNSLANTTIDEVMADNKNIDNNENNDFWFSQEEAPLDLNSLPDINTPTDSTPTNNIFFGDNNATPNLEFPSLEGQNTDSEKEA